MQNTFLIILFIFVNKLKSNYKRLLSKTFLMIHVMIYYLSLVEKIKYVILSLLRYLISLSLIHVI